MAFLNLQPNDHFVVLFRALTFLSTKEDGKIQAPFSIQNEAFIDHNFCKFSSLLRDQKR